MYLLLKNILRAAIYSYFKRVTITGKEHIPKDAPVIFACNHPSGFMDPILVAVNLNRKAHFLAGADFFFNKIVAWIFRQLWMIPIYRPDKMPGQGHKNEEMFRACYDHLGKNGALMIFPEGVSITEKKIKKIKTGAARIMFGAEKAGGFKLGVQIVPIGINYTNPHEFQSEVIINIGEPIEARDYLDHYMNDEKGTVVEVTETLEKALKSLTHHYENEQVGILTEKISLVYGHQLRADVQDIENKHLQDFVVGKEIHNGLEYLIANHPEQYVEIKKAVDTYMSQAEALGFADWRVRISETHIPIIPSILLGIAGLPVVAVGYLGNLVPYELTAYITRKMIKDVVFRGSFLLTLGMVLFLAWYISIYFIVRNLVHWEWGLAAVAGLMISGYLTPFLIRHITRLNLKYRFFKVVYKQSDQALWMFEARKKLFALLQEAKEKYLSYAAVNN